MVKIHYGPVGEIFSWIHFAHIPQDLDPSITPWHLVHEYTGDIYDFMGTITMWSGPFYTDPEIARLAALDLQARCQVITDMCPDCHPTGFHFPPTLPFPRYNIYRGQRGEPLVPCFYWDIFNPDPPPGYEWAYPYPLPPP